MAGTQFLMQDCVDGASESVYDHELQQIFDMVRTKQGVILASGDVHVAEIKQYPCLDQTIHEITSSGLTHSVSTAFGA